MGAAWTHKTQTRVLAKVPLADGPGPHGRQTSRPLSSEWGLPWSLELRNFTSKGQQDLFIFRADPPPPSAGFNVTFEDLMLSTSAGAPLIFARLTAVTTKHL